MAAPKITVTIKLENNVVLPHFHQNVCVTGIQRELIYFLQAAVDLDDKFKFTATYFTGMGYFIDAFGTCLPKTPEGYFWLILGNNVPLKVGVSTYVPHDNETITFRLQKIDPCPPASE